VGYFNYHAKAKRLINEGKLISYEFREQYNKISPVLLLFFEGGLVMPIREHRFLEYLALIEKNSKEKQDYKDS